MSIRDIIEAVATTAEAVRAGSDRGTEGADRRQAAWSANQEFIAAFDHEHVALMEAERVAARELIDAADEKDMLRFDGARIRYTLARKATDDHRKERGL